MSVDIKTPELPESVDEATLLTWHIEHGGAVRRDDKLADVETDKIVLEVFSPADGILHTLVKEGGTLKRGDKLARIENAGVSPAPLPEPPAKAAAPAKKADDAPVAPGNPDGDDDEFPKAKGDIDSDEVTQAELVGLPPGVRKLLMENGIHPSDVTGSGKDGRITRADVLKYIEETPLAKKNIGLGEASTGLVVVPPPAARKETPAAPRGVPDPHQRRVPMSQLRQRVASRLKEVQNTAALLTTFNEVNMKPVMDLRAKYKERFEKEYGVKLGFMSFFVKAAVEALKKYPVVNAALDGKDIVFHEAYHIGIAVDSPRGLVVPVLRNAERLGFAEIEKTIRDLAGKAKDAKLAYDDLIGGTFTITNGGVFGSMLSTPIINAPQSAILGMHAIQDRPWVEAGQVVVRPVMYLALTYDHRLIDGRDAVQFLVSLKESLEDPAQLLLQL